MAKRHVFVPLNQKPQFIGKLFIFTSAIMLLVGVWLAKTSLELVSSGVTAQGKVVEMVRKTDEDGSITYAPIIHFTTNKNELIEFASNSSTNPPRYQIGDRVEVIYLNQRPNQAKTNTWLDLWFGPTLTIAMSLLFGGLGYGLNTGKLKPIIR